MTYDDSLEMKLANRAEYLKHISVMATIETYGTETMKHRGQRLCLSLPQHAKNAQSVTIEFKNKIKSWNGAECTCRLCRTFIPQLGFI